MGFWATEVRRDPFFCGSGSTWATRPVDLCSTYRGLKLRWADGRLDCKGLMCRAFSPRDLLRDANLGLRPRLVCCALSALCRRFASWPRWQVGRGGKFAEVASWRRGCLHWWCAPLFVARARGRLWWGGRTTEILTLRIRMTHRGGGGRRGRWANASLRVSGRGAFAGRGRCGRLGVGRRGRRGRSMERRRVSVACGSA